MKTLEELASEIDAGKLVILVWDGIETFVFCYKQRYYLCTANGGWWTDDGESLADLLSEVEASKPKGKDGYSEYDWALKRIQQTIKLPLWTAIDTQSRIGGVSLLSLRDELEAGESAYCLVDDRVYPYKVEKNEHGEVWFIAPSPMNDILSSYRDLEDLYSRHLRAHLPIWQKGTSTAYQAIEAEYERQQEEQARELAALDALPPVVVEMSAREHQQYQAWKEEEPRRVAALYAGNQDGYFDPFLDDIEEKKPANVVPLVFRQAFGEDKNNPQL